LDRGQRQDCLSRGETELIGLILQLFEADTFIKKKQSVEQRSPSCGTKKV
jgi:hypothetical protein